MNKCSEGGWKDSWRIVALDITRPDCGARLVAREDSNPLLDTYAKGYLSCLLVFGGSLD